MGASSPRKDQATTGKSRSPEPEEEESLTPVAWLRLRWVYTGSDIGPQPLPTHVTDVTRTQVDRHVSPDTCINIKRVGWVTHELRCFDTGNRWRLDSPPLHSPVDSLLTHSTQCQGPRPPMRPRSPHPTSARLDFLKFNYPIFRDLLCRLLMCSMMIILWSRRFLCWFSYYLLS